MQTGLDRRTFLARAAVASGGLLSMGALERLVTRDAFAHGDRAQPYGPLRRTQRPARDRGARAPRGLQLRHVQPHRQHDVGRQSDAARARRDGRVRRRPQPRPSRTARARRPPRPARAQQRGPQPGGDARRPARRPHRRRTTRPATAAPPRWSSTSAGSELVEDFVSLNGTIVNCAGGIAYRRRYWLTGEETVGGPDSDRSQRRASPSGTATCSRRRSTATRTSSNPACRSPPRVASRTRRRPSTSERASSTRPRTRARASAPGFYRYTPNNPDDLTARRQARDARHHGAAPQIDLRAGPHARRAPARQLGADRQPRPDAHGDRRPEQHVQPGLGEGRREVQPPRGLLGGRQHDLLRLHQRRRREERRRQLRRLRGGLRSGVGLPPRAAAAGR